MITDKIKAGVYDTLIAHLQHASKDTRKREQLRAMVALRKIERWTQDETNKNRNI